MVGSELEKAYPDLYKGVSRQLNITMSSEDIVRRTFMQIAEYVFRGEPNWGKIISLFAVAGAFSVDCAQQGHSEYVNKIVDSFGNFVGKNIADWIANQGGWVSVTSFAWSDCLRPLLLSHSTVPTRFWVR
jgi:hypothetical protein